MEIPALRDQLDQLEIPALRDQLDQLEIPALKARLDLRGLTERLRRLRLMNQTAIYTPSGRINESDRLRQFGRIAVSNIIRYV